MKEHPDAIQKASEKIVEMVDNFKNVMSKIDRQLVENWVRDLVIIKTFIGLRFQEAVLEKIGELLKKDYRLATPVAAFRTSTRQGSPIIHSVFSRRNQRAGGRDCQTKAN